MINAYLYLQWMTVRNATAQRLSRLKQPKYLIGAIAGGAYFTYFLSATSCVQTDASRFPRTIRISASSSSDCVPKAWRSAMAG